MNEAELRFAVFGGPRVWRDGVELDIGSPQRRTLLALLLAAGGDAVPFTEIMAALWDREPPPSAANAVHRLVGELRRLLEPELANREIGDWLTPVGLGYRLVVDVTSCDLMRLRELVDQGGPVTEIAAIVRDRACADAEIDGHPLVVAAEEDRVRATTLTCDLVMESGAADASAVLAAVVRVAADHPFNEALQARLIRLLTAAGRRADALAAYTATRRRLVYELGVEPGGELRAAQREALGDEPEPLAAPGPVPAQLPAVGATLTGRKAEFAAAMAHLRSARSGVVGPPICAITGMAGIGKTTLAVHLGHRLAAAYSDGQLFVNLRGFDPAGTAMASDEAIRGFLSALGAPSIPSEPGARVALYRSLTAGRRILVVLDNVRDSDHARPLLPTGPDCVCIVTSRNAMSGLVSAEGAHAVPLVGLSRESAHALLADRLGESLLEAEPAAANRIVAACAGLPLALSLVAARALRSTSRSLRAIQARLVHPSETLDVLSGSETSSDLRAIFAASYNTMSEPTARMFRLLAVHPGPEIGVYAAASIAGVALRDARRALDELTTASLMSEPADSRYQAHDLIRIYADELATADEREMATERLISHYVAATRAAYLAFGRKPFFVLPELADGVSFEDHPDTGAADQWYEAERPTSEAVVHLALARGNGLAAAAIVVDWRPMAYSSAYETAVLPFLMAVLAAVDPDDDSVVTAEVLRYAGDPTFWVNHYEESRTLLERALTIFRNRDDLSGQSRTLRNLSRLTGLQKRWAEEVEFLDLSVATARAAGDAGTLAVALSDSIVRLCRLGRIDEAANASNEAIRVAEQAGLRYYVADVLGNEAYGLVGAGHYEAALDRVEKYAVARVQLGRTKVLEEMFELLIRGHAYRGVGRNDDARRAFEKYLDLRGTVDSFDYTSDWEGFAEPDAIRAILAELHSGPSGTGRSRNSRSSPPRRASARGPSSK